MSRRSPRDEPLRSKAMSLWLEVNCKLLVWGTAVKKGKTVTKHHTSQSNCTFGCLLPPGFTPRAVD